MLCRMTEILDELVGEGVLVTADKAGLLLGLEEGPVNHRPIGDGHV